MNVTKATKPREESCLLNSLHLNRPGTTMVEQELQRVVALRILQA